MLLVRLLFRILSGEPYRKATPTELRWYSGLFCFLPVFGFVFVHFGSSFLDRASGLGVWFYAMAAMLAVFCFLSIWTKYVPAMTSWILGAVVWTIAFVLSFSGRL
jgi:hypothetical protein